VLNQKALVATEEVSETPNGS